MISDLVNAYFRSNSLVNQQLQSYDKFIDVVMQSVIDNIGKIQTNVEGFELKLGKIRVV
jgi:DNA-directed RNA polymerase, beta subunit/140 kD subunit